MANKKVRSDDFTYKILHTVDNDMLTRLLAVYKDNPKHARVLFMSNKDLCVRRRVVIFEWSNGDFDILQFSRSFGISKTNVMYHRERLLCGIRYRGGLLYSVTGTNSIKQATWFVCRYGFNNYDRYSVNDSVYDYLINRFSWLRNLGDDIRLHHFGLNIVFKNKLFSNNKLLRYLYKTPLPVLNVFSDVKGGLTHKDWKIISPYLINITSLTQELFTNTYFTDSVRMAEIIGKKINCAWSLKRLKVEHDKMAKEITNIILKYEPLRNLNIGLVFKKFAEYSGYTMLMTNHDLIAEGNRMGHCVGTYSSSVDSGSCSIYVVGGYTLQVSNNRYSFFSDNNAGLSLSQFMSFGNIPVCGELYDSVFDMIESFNKEYFVDGKFIGDDEFIDVFINDDNLVNGLNLF
jgi:hypothetical protein